MKYRRKVDIMADIISVAGQGARKTKIMHFANLSHLLLKRYLEVSLRVGLLQEIGDKFSATQKGREFLNKYNRFSDKYSRMSTAFEALQSEAEELEWMCRLRKSGVKSSRRSRLATLG